MRHTLDDLAERADDRGDGRFYIIRHGEDDAPRGGRWEAGMRDDRDTYHEDTGHGDTADDAIQDLLNQQEGPAQ